MRSRQLDGFKFVRQFPIGPHIADFACRSARPVVELDGGQHNETADADRTDSLQSYGYMVIRFWNHDVLTNMAGVLETIHANLMLASNR
ncbi:MAG: endonuclease domain-containing protein [Sphingobium sp.]